MIEKRCKQLALILGPSLYALVLAVAIWSNYSAPRLTTHFDWENEAWTAVADSEMVKKDDRLEMLAEDPATFHTLLVDNAFLSSRKEFFEWLDTKAKVYEQLSESTVSARVSRQGERVSLQLPVIRHTWDFLTSPGLIHFPVSLIFLLVGWATYRQTGANKQAQWFYFLCLSMSLVYLTNVCSLLCYPVLYPTIFAGVNVLNAINFVMAPALLLHFSLLMPSDRAKPWILALIYLPAGLSLVTFKLAWHAILVPVFFLTSLLVIAQGAFSYRGFIERQQMKWVGVGFLLGVGPWFLLNGLPLILTGQRLMSDTLPGACLVFIPIFMAVAVQRYRLFDISSFLEGTFVYLASVAILVGVDLLLLKFLGFGVVLGEWQILALALVLGLYGPVRAKLASLISHLAHRSRASDKEALQILIGELANASLEQIPAALRATVQRLFAPLSFEEIESGEQAVGAYLEVREKPTVLLVIAPRVALRCGPLPKGRFYDSRDVELLEVLTLHCSLSYQAAYNYHKAMEERSRSLQEKEQLLSDLHDGVGSALANIKMTSEQEKITRLAADALFEIQSFLYDGPEYTKSRESFVAELRSYGSDFFQAQATTFTFEAHGDLRASISRSTALSLFRLFKESLVNVLKHSSAETLVVTLDFAEELVMTICDDGKGLDGSNKGRGLTGMKMRVKELGGELDVQSEDGTQLIFRIPLG